MRLNHREKMRTGLPQAEITPFGAVPAAGSGFNSSAAKAGESVRDTMVEITVEVAMVTAN